MKKTISGVLLALTAVFALVACGKKKTTTAEKSGDDTKVTTKKTTKEHKRKGQKNVITFYCWNNEFQTRVNDYYKEGTDGVSVDGGKSKLPGGVTIIWVATPNEGSAYQDALDLGLENDMVDMFVFEADFATKYVKSDIVCNMADLSVDQSAQYKYTKDIVTNDAGKIVGSSWQATPGILIYNKNVTDLVTASWAADHDSIATKLSTFDGFKAAAADVKTAGKKMLIGPACWYRIYGNNLKEKMWNGSKITVDKNLFQWVKDTKEFKDNGYIVDVADDYALWGSEWGKEQGKDNAMCIFSCPWFTDFCLTGNRKVAAGEDSGLRATAGYASWFWGGTWLTATTVSQQEDTIKGKVAKIIQTMTTDADTLMAISDGTQDFTNNEAKMDAKGADTTVSNSYFGGQNVFTLYAAAVKKADLSKCSDYDQQITEGFQSAFMKYFQGSKKASEAWTTFKEELQTKTSITAIEAAAGVTIADDITIA